MYLLIHWDDDLSSIGHNPMVSHRAALKYSANAVLDAIKKALFTGVRKTFLLTAPENFLKHLHQDQHSIRALTGKK
jgi:hypothetical protein